MATAGIPWARVVVVLVLLAVPAAFVAFDQTAAAQEGNASALLSKGLEQLRAGDLEAGKASLRQALALDPSNEDIMKALGRAEYEALLALIASGSDGANIAKALLDRAMPILPDEAFDEEQLGELVKTAAMAEEYSERFEAAMTLARRYGEFAVPGLVAFLASSNTEYRVNAHITLMRRLGRDAVLPLNEAFGSDNADVRRLVAAELGAIGDERAIPALAEAAANDQEPSAREEAAKALQGMAARFPFAVGMSPSALYLRLAERYYQGDYRVMAYADRPLVLWSWSDGGLQGQPVPRHLFVLKLAEEAAYDALRLDPSNGPARAMLARILASEKLAADVMKDVAEDELSQSFGAGLGDANGTIAALGWETLRQALSDALDQKDQAAAAALLDVMPQVYASSDFTTDNPVVRATTDTAGNVRLAAAEAVLRFNSVRRITAFPDPDGFINLVATSVGEVVPRQILVVDGHDERRNKILTDLNEAKYTVFDARTGSEGVVRAVRFSGLDLIVLSADLVDMDPQGALDQLGADARTKNIPVMVVGTVEQAADEQWRGLYSDKAKAVAGIAPGPGIGSAEFQKLVADSFEGQAPGAEARYAKSADILDALATTDTDNALFNWNALTETLAGMLTADLPADPPVRMNALRALGNIADVGALDALAAYFGSESDGGLRAAAAMAVASICRHHDVSLTDDVFQALLKGTKAKGAEVRVAAFAALGSAMLTPEQSLAAATATRPGVGGDMAEEDFGE